MLKEIEIKNFKSLKKVKLPNLSKINVLFGPNNSGEIFSTSDDSLGFSVLRKGNYYDGSFVNLKDFSNVLFRGRDANKMESFLKFELGDEEVNLLQERAKDGSLAGRILKKSNTGWK